VVAVAVTTAAIVGTPAVAIRMITTIFIPPQVGIFPLAVVVVIRAGKGA
jgi:hypothetical protein